MPSSTDVSQRAASAVQSLRLIHSSQTSYRWSNGRYTDLTTLSANKYFTDPLLAAGSKSNYLFTLAVNADDPASNYEAAATPDTSPASWQHFYVDGTGVIRFAHGGPANAISQPLN